jgi:hypothetical protein
MTPSALTPAARGTTKKSRPDAPSRPSSARNSGHRSNVRRSVAPTAPRRVSGPAGAAASGGVIAVPAPARTRPTRPTRPTTAPGRTRTRTRPAAARAPWRLRSAAYVRALPDNALLDRVIRGRVWIPLLGVLLAGIVAMQVEVLKLNAGIGRSIERGSALQAQNELLRASVAQLSDEQRIERMAVQMGMLMPGPGQLKFVNRGSGSVERALTSIHAPDATNFLAQLPAIGAASAPQGTSVNTSPGLTPTGAASAPSSSTASSTAPSTSSTGTTVASGTAGTVSSGTTAATATGTGDTSQTSPVTPTAPTTSAGTTGQSGSSSSGGVGATPVGG